MAEEAVLYIDAPVPRRSIPFTGQEVSAVVGGNDAQEPPECRLWRRGPPPSKPWPASCCVARLLDSRWPSSIVMASNVAICVRRNPNKLRASGFDFELSEHIGRG